MQTQNKTQKFEVIRKRNMRLPTCKAVDTKT